MGETLYLEEWYHPLQQLVLMTLGHLVNKRMFLPLGRLFGSQRVRREQGRLAKGKTLGGGGVSGMIRLGL